jgi:hypothetical protein
MTNNLMTIFLYLCDPLRDSLAVSASEQTWEHISELARLHGVTPFLFYRTRHLGIPVPEKIRKEWLGIYLYSLAQDQKARRQIKELKEILDPAGVPFILLKGASALLRLYPEPALRTFCDLDILIPEAMVSRFKGIMTKAGYKPMGVRNSPEDEELQKFDNHLDPLLKEENLMIEPHLSVLGTGGNHLALLPEIWRDKEDAKSDGIFIGHLSKEYFIIHTLLHIARDLSIKGFVEIKGFIDVVYAIGKWEIDWLMVEETSKKWDVERDILPAIATLNQYWTTEIALAKKANPLDLHTLVSGVEDQKKHYYSKIPAGYIKRLCQTRKLPGTLSKLRYFLHLFFPARENLRSRYAPTGKSILPYYSLHFFVQCRKVFMGLWYQFLKPSRL